MRIVKHLGLLFIAIGLSSCIQAQDIPPFGSGTSQTIGGITYSDFRTDRGRVSATHQRIGRFEYGTYSNGASSTSFQIGSIRYTDYREPIRSRYYVPSPRRR